MTAIAELTRLVPPPDLPVETPEDWTQVETSLGRPLPADVKALVELYGKGEFNDFLYVDLPVIDYDLAGYLEDDRERQAEWPEEYPYPLYPEAGGLLIWGGTSNGDRLCWLTDGEPDTWPVVVWNPRDGDYERHETSAVDFLAGWLTGRVVSELFPDDEDDDVAPWFAPLRQLTHVYVRLADGELPYPERLRILREALAPTVSRGGTEFEGSRQDHFAATESGWEVTYETMYGHQIRVAFPPQDEHAAREAVLAAAERMGCGVLSAMTDDGTAVWGC